MEFHDWLKDIAVGTEVIIHARDNRGVGEVIRLTKTMIIVKYNVDYEDRFNRFSGHTTGSDIGDSRSISEATPELVAAVKAENRKRNRVAFLHKVAWSTLELEQLEKVYELVKGAKSV